jgi:hypothetical protein
VAFDADAVADFAAMTAAVISCQCFHDGSFVLHY